MNTIQLDEILSIYKTCGLGEHTQNPIRTQINTGFLCKRLNLGLNRFFLPDAETVGNTHESIYRVHPSLL